MAQIKFTSSMALDAICLLNHPQKQMACNPIGWRKAQNIDPLLH